MRLTECILCLFINIIAVALANTDCPVILTREDWKGDKAVQVDYRVCPLDYVVVHHTVTNTCETREGCSELVRNIQAFHIDELDFNDIGYNFLIGSDGYVYEGPGWRKIGAHTRGYNSRSIGLALIGNFSSKSPSEKQLETAKRFLECAVSSGDLDPHYALLGAKQVSSTLSPGRRAYIKIKTWPNFESDPISRKVSVQNCTVVQQQ